MKKLSLEEIRTYSTSKTKKCRYCEGRHKIDKMTFLFTDPKTKKEYWVCDDCNKTLNLKPI